MIVNVLGTDYKILKKDYHDELSFSERGIDGYCDCIDKVIVVGNMKTFPNFENETDDYCKKLESYTLRHELIHAFLSESGLQDSSTRFADVAWSKNEEMIDFFAIQFPKIAKVFEDLKIL